MEPEEIEDGVQRWERAVESDSTNMDVHEFIGIALDEFESWLKTRKPIIVIGVDIDTVATQYTHVVIGAGHFDKYPLCGADTLWGYHEGTMDRVTCPECLRRVT